VNSLLKHRVITLVVFLLANLAATSVWAHGDGHQLEKNPLFSGLNSSAARTVKQFHYGLRNGDEKLARRQLADDVLIYEGGGVERSAEEYANHHMKADMKFLKALQIKNQEHQVKTIGNMAISTARSTMKGNYQGKQVDISSMESIVLRKSNGAWLITHIHWSN